MLEGLPVALVSMPGRLLALIVVAFAVLPLLAASATHRGRATVDVRHDGQVFHVRATLFAPVPPDLAWDVLTDFDHMSTFVPNVSTSRVTSRDGNRLTIEQRGVARFGPLTFGFASERAIDLTPRSEIRSVQTRGNMRRLESLTQFSAEEGGTALVYLVEVEPGALYPAALTERFLRDEIGEQFEAIVAEMLRRKAARGL